MCTYTFYRRECEQEHVVVVTSTHTQSHRSDVGTKRIMIAGWFASWMGVVVARIGEGNLDDLICKTPNTLSVDAPDVHAPFMRYKLQYIDGNKRFAYSLETFAVCIIRALRACGVSYRVGRNIISGSHDVH